jgi:hypothetical protein
MKLRNNRSSTIEDKVLEAIQQRGAGDYIAEGLGTGVTSALGFVGDRKNRIGQQALGVGQGLTGEYKRRRDASPEFTEINIRGNTGQLPSGDSRLQDLATYNLPGMSLETLGTMMLLTEEQATDLAKTIGLQGARLANTVMQATKTPQGTGQLVSDTVSWIAKNAPENLEEAQKALWKFGESLTAGDVTGLGSVAMAPIKRGLKKTLKDADETSQLTQRGNTFPTYENADAVLNRKNPTGETLDYGAGLGKSQSLGYKTFEPFPKKGFKPDFLDPSEIASGSFSRITNLNVLNVLPKEARDQAVQEIGRIVAPNGQVLITTRKSKNDVLDKHGKVRPGQKQGSEEGSVFTGTGTFQKGFDQFELESYIKEILGDGFDVERPAKSGINTSHVLVTKKKPEEIRNTIGRASLTVEQLKQQPVDLNEIKKINADIDLIKGVRGSTNGIPNSDVEKELFRLREVKFAEYVQKYGYDNEFAIEMRKHYDSLKHPERSKLITVTGDTKVYTDTPAARRREKLRGNLPPGERAVASYSRIPGMRDPSERIVRPYEDLLGYEGVMTVGDRMDSGLILDAIADAKTDTPLGGGGLYSFHMGKNVETGEQGWASMNPIAQRFQDKIVSVHEATGRPVLGVHVLMGQDASNFSVPVVQAMVNQLDQIKIPKSDLSKFDEVVNKEINKKNKKIREDNETELKQAEKEGRDPILEEEVVPFVGLNDPRYFDQLLGLNEFPREGSGALRKSVVETMSKVQLWGPLGFPNYKDVLKAVNVDELEKLRTGSSGYSLFEFDPTVDPKKLPASPHPSYAYGIPGKDFGRLERADIPFHVMYPDIAEQTRHQKSIVKAKTDKETGEKIPEHEVPKNFAEQRFTAAFGKSYSQPFDERWLQGILDFAKQNPIIDGSNIPLAFLMLGAASLNTPEGETE